MKKGFEELKRIREKSRIYPNGSLTSKKIISFFKKIIHAGAKEWDTPVLQYALSMLGFESVKMRNYDGAETILRRLIKIGKDIHQENMRVYYILICVLLQNGKLHASRYWFKKAWKLKNQNPYLAEELKNKLAIELAFKYPSRHLLRKRNLSPDMKKDVPELNELELLYRRDPQKGQVLYEQALRTGLAEWTPGALGRICDRLASLSEDSKTAKKLLRLSSKFAKQEKDDYMQKCSEVLRHRDYSSARFWLQRVMGDFSLQRSPTYASELIDKMHVDLSLKEQFKLYLSKLKSQRSAVVQRNKT